MKLVSKLLLSTLFLIVISSPAFPTRKERVVDKWKPIHYLVNIKLNRQLTEIESAKTQIDIKALKRLSVIDLDFGELTTDRVNLNSKPIQFTHQNGQLNLQLPEPVNAGTTLSITVDYHGKPEDGLIFSPDKDGRAAVVGDNWPNRVHQWIPSLDHPSAKASVTFNITAAAENLVVANGSLDHVETTGDGNRTWTYTEEAAIPPYCMIIGVGQFNRQEPAHSTLTPLSYYVPGSDGPQVQHGFAPANPIVQFFSQTVGQYPYEKLALIVGNTRFGGMENSGAIVFAANLFTPNRAARAEPPYEIPDSLLSVVAHEIAHQWFGDSVTESTWADLWLSEGFATYFAGLFIQRSQGEAAFQDYMKKAAETAFQYEEKTTSPVFDRDTEDLMKLLNPNNYQKGAWVLHMLRSQLGDEDFFKGIRSYYEAHKNGNATTEDLRVALEKSSRKDLDQFFKRWIYDSGHPIYKLTSNWDNKRRELMLKVEQLQTGNLFYDPVPIAIESDSGIKIVVFAPQGKVATKSIKLTSQPKTIVVDGGNTLLKEVKGN